MKRLVKSAWHKLLHERLLKSYIFYRVLKYAVEKKYGLEKDTYIMLLDEKAKGYGFTMMHLGLHDAIETRNGLKLVYFLNKEHEIIARLYDKEANVRYFEGSGAHSVRSRLLGYYMIAQADFAKNKRVATSALLGGGTAGEKPTAIEEYQEGFGLTPNDLARPPKNLDFKLSEKIINELESKAGMNFDALKSRLIMINPHANTVSNVTPEFFQNLADELNQNGFIVLSNVMSESCALKNSIYLPLTQSEAFALALQCFATITMRSGFSDMLHFLPSLIVINYDAKSAKRYELASMFEGSGAKEIVYGDKACEKVLEIIKGLNQRA